MKITLPIGLSASESSIKQVKKNIEALHPLIWATYTGFHHSKRRMIVSMPSEEWKERVLETSKSITDGIYEADE